MEPDILAILSQSGPVAALLALVSWLARAYLTRIETGMARLATAQEEHTRSDAEHHARVEARLAVIEHVLPRPQPRAVDHPLD